MAGLEGTYVPSTSEWVRNQVDTYERSGGTEANTLGDTGIPVIIVTMRGASTGHVRKIALMRVEHNGTYALVASKGGAPDDPDWVRDREQAIRDSFRPTPWSQTAGQLLAALRPSSAAVRRAA